SRRARFTSSASRRPTCARRSSRSSASERRTARASIRRHWRRSGSTSTKYGGRSRIGSEPARSSAPAPAARASRAARRRHSTTLGVRRTLLRLLPRTCCSQSCATASRSPPRSSTGAASLRARSSRRSHECTARRPDVFERFTERARQVVVLAQDEARSLNHNYIGTEHLLLGLLREDEGVGASVLESLGVTLEEVRAQVARIVGQGDDVMSGQIPFTPRAKKVLELSLKEAVRLGHNHIGTEHLLLGLARENQGVASRILLDFDVDAERVRDEVLRFLSGRSMGLVTEGAP